MMTFRHKHTAALASAVLLTQSVCGGLPVTKLRTVNPVRSAADFSDILADRIQQPEDAFESLRYDAKEDQLYRDDTPVGKSCGRFTVSAGKVYADGIPVTEDQARAYQAGQVLPVDEALRGFYTPTLNGLNLGWGKASEGQLKNHYPKGLRRSGYSVDS